MGKVPQYYYDESQCTFVEVKRKRTTFIKRAAAMLALSCVVGSGLYWGLYDFWGSPEVIELRAENRALRDQLESTESRMGAIDNELDQLAQTDKELYRTILQAEPIIPPEFSPSPKHLGTGLAL